MIPFKIKERKGHGFVTVLHKSGESAYFVYFEDEKNFGFLSESDIIQHYIFVSCPAWVKL